MHLRMNPWYLMHGSLVVGFHLAQSGDRLGQPALAVGPVRPTDPAQPDHWSVPGLHLERASIETSVPGTTVRPGVGELTLAGYDPDVLVRAVAVLEGVLEEGERA